ncbi:Alanine racemase [hydrothermal vent metagenome]|uniref:alanine racemase n=1 Tax=hydrothermal vent metagenome TaxID=652676 RepID=A0A3B1AY44_9ZZZZ
MSRATRADINLSALKHNLQIARANTQAKIMAVVKANGYGHGMVEIARALSNSDGFAVATINEAMDLRESGVYQPILTLEGFNCVDDLRMVYAYDLQCVIHNEQQIELLEKNKPKNLNVWLKIDTGMHRLGFSPQQASEMYQRLQDCPYVRQPVHVMTHLACADDQSSKFTSQQVKIFNDSIAELALGDKAQLSVANSAGLLAWPDAHQNTQWVRPGIMLYGSSPTMKHTAEHFELKPVMTLKSEVIAIHDFNKGDSVGYGQSYVCDKDTRVATIAIGYGDGYPRHANTGTPVLINGSLFPLIGRVSMDMITVDVSKAKNVNVGDEVVLWGEGLSADLIAEHANTISYDLFCGVTQRVPFNYSNAG